MALGSKGSFKSYIDEPAEKSSISFDDDGGETQNVILPDQSHGAVKVEGKTGKGTIMANNSEDLLVLNDRSAPTHTKQNNADSDVEEIQPVDMMSTTETVDSNRLCGYLNKYKVGARGLGRNFKKRWFVFVDSSCKLLYFRTPQDIVPLGEIDVSNASFNIEISHDGGHASGKDHVFEIRWVDL